MSDQLSALDAAVDSCCAYGADAARLRHLRELTEWPLIERMTLLSTDRDCLTAALDEAFARFASVVCAMRDINWLAWLTAHALACLAVEIGQTAWIDDVSEGRPGEPVDRRALVFGAILAMDGNCQERLLRRVTGGFWAGLLARECQAGLEGRLSNIWGPPSST